MRYFLFVITLLCLSFENANAFQNQQQSDAWLEIKNTDGDSVLIAIFQNKSEEVLPLWYELTSEVQTVTGGNITNNHQGAFVAMPYEKLNLTEIKISTSQFKAYAYNLFIFADDKLLHKKNIKHGKLTKNKKEITIFEKKPALPSPPPKKVQSQSLEDLEIDGLIIDETRSKTGHDFYDLFYRKWVAPQGAKDFIITIKELPSLGRASRVSIEVNDKEVLKRAVSPRADVVELLAEQSIYIVKRHLQQRESLKESLDNEDQQGSGIF